MEKSEIANKAKTEFLENMRHDIRTPLTGIVGFADILKLELTLSFDSSIPEHLIGDKIRVHRVVLELIANALNFIGKRDTPSCLKSYTNRRLR
ncbi:MAG: Sensor histidine kinase RcsC [Legionella sp.]|uniref:histidine kinase dimerization/phospho-acceptor domain-containing protein n=1 Tax=Legionella sp. TaxID=459 RepID=UPI003D0FC800